MSFLKNFSLNIRPRTQYTVLGTIVVFLLMIISDPSLGIITEMPFGAEQLVLLTIIAKSVLYATLLHVTRKAFLDYPEADIKNAMSKAIETPTGAGLIVIGVGLITVAFSIVIALAASA
jgi:hypothetical protein